MREIFILICRALLALCVLVLCYVLIVWVFNQLGIPVPTQILQIVMVIVVLLGLIAIASGRFGNWWPPKQ